MALFLSDFNKLTFGQEQLFFSKTFFILPFKKEMNCLIVIRPLKLFFIALNLSKTLVIAMILAKLFYVIYYKFFIDTLHYFFKTPVSLVYKDS